MKLAYRFEENNAECGSADAELLGGKGANLSEMCNMGLPVPCGVIIPTTACNAYLNDMSTSGPFLDGVVEQAATVLQELQAKTGDFLCSVRSSGAASMPGMMDSILNVGISDRNLERWQKKLGKRVALDCYRRLYEGYGQVVCDIPETQFTNALSLTKQYKYGAKSSPATDADMTIKHLESLIGRYKKVFESYGHALPESKFDQLRSTVGAVFLSWNSDRAKAYRDDNKISHDAGTAVVIQRMVYGNMNNNSASGVMFTRCPTTGAVALVGEFLPNAQGEDVVAGVRTPRNMDKMNAWNSKVYNSLYTIAEKLERHYKDMQDVEFTVEDGDIYILQTRTGLRESLAKFRIAYDMCQEGHIDKSEALSRVTGEDYANLLQDRVDPSYDVEPDIQGLPASSGIVRSKVVITPAQSLACPGRILVRKDTSPKDYKAMKVSGGLLTGVGGITCHAAVVARALNLPCIVGAGADIVDTLAEQYTGESITLDGNTGRVWMHTNVPIIMGEIPAFVDTMREWALDIRGSSLMYIVDPKSPSDLPEEGRYCLKTGNVERKVKAKQAFADVLLAVKANTDISGIIDLSPKSDQDAEFYYFLGMREKIEDDASIASKVAVLKQPRWTNKMKSSWAIHAPEHVVEEIRAAGWKTVSDVTSLGEFLQVDGYYSADPTLQRALVSQGTSLEGVTEILVAAGRTVKPMPKAIYESETTYALFG